MSFFTSFFGSGTESVESRLHREYTVIFQAMMSIGSPEAAAKAHDMLSKAREEVLQRGWAEQGPTYGDWLLTQEAVNPKLHAALEALRQEGVRDEDVRWWWNMPPLERVMIMKADELGRMAAYIGYLKQGMSEDESAQGVWKIHPMFGNPQDGQGEDRPLPNELKRRIVAFIEKHYRTPEVMSKLVQEASSFNALVRAEIRRGNL